MITRELEAFVTTANVGSFQKASDLLFISSTALIKQINALEEETGLTLFIRTNRGIQLTEEGKIFHGIARDILQRYALGIQAARNKRAELGTPIRIGLSPMSPFMSFAEEMLPENDLNRYFTLEFLPISSDYKDFMEEMQNLGARVDMIPYILGQNDLKGICNTFCLANLPLRIAVPKGHPLSGRKKLGYDDLAGQEIYTISGDVNEYYREINQEIKGWVPEAKLHSVRYFDFGLLNRAACNQCLILAPENMKHVHPLFSLLEGPWAGVIPYGVYYGRNPSDPVIRFTEALMDLGISGRPINSRILVLT